MFFVYSLVYTLGFVLLLPRFLFDALAKGKYAAGFKQRLGYLPPFEGHPKKVIWLHCVSVGEVNAARPLAQQIKERFPDSSLVISTTTRTGQTLASTAFANIADLVFYFPFDWKWTVRRSLARIKPSVVLLMETEIWFNFIHESFKSGAHVAIVNGRLSARSLERYARIPKFIRRILGYVNIALMQENADATRLMSLGMRATKVKVTGNLKFDNDLDVRETVLTAEFRERFAITPSAPLIIAASTHAREEAWILDAFKEFRKDPVNGQPRLMIAPRHPERFAEAAELVKNAGFTWARRSEAESGDDRLADVILLDSIGELRAAYPLAEIVFVGGSLIRQGGQSIFEPASAGKAIVTGPHTVNFAAAVREFLKREALLQLTPASDAEIVPTLVRAFNELLSDQARRQLSGNHALEVMNNNRGSVSKTMEYLSPLLDAAAKR